MFFRKRKELKKRLDNLTQDSFYYGSKISELLENRNLFIHLINKFSGIKFVKSQVFVYTPSEESKEKLEKEGYVVKDVFELDYKYYVMKKD